VKAMTRGEKVAARKAVAKARKDLRKAMKAAGATRTRKRVRLYRDRHTRMRWTPEIENYRTWSHDFDTVIHGLARNPGAISLSPTEFVQRCADIADAMRTLQDGRRPKDYDRW
jgi:hypothetical protein